MRLERQHSNVMQTSRVVVLILWGATFVGVHWWAAGVYVVPLLALVTFYLLPPFPIVIGALFLSAYLEVYPNAAMSDTLKLVLIGATWLAALVVLGANARRHRISVVQPKDEKHDTDDEIPAQAALSTIEPTTSVSSEAALSPHFRHDVRTPLNLILGFCEALLNPTSPNQPALPAPFREDVEAIYRNSQQLKPLIEQLLERIMLLPADKPATDVSAAGSRRSVILLDESGAAFELFSHYLPQYEVVPASSVEAVARARLDADALVVAVNSGDGALIPVVAQLMGNTVPIVTFNLNNTPPQAKFLGADDYLLKPVEFATLMAALERTGARLHTILIVDDNRDTMQMMSRMLNSVAEPPRLLKAYSGREALALLQEETPDIILLDFVLPDMDCTALLSYLRADSKLARIPVILVSAHRPPDILPAVGTTKLTLFQLTGLSPSQLARHIEALFVALGDPS